ncbi:MAG: ATP-binding cassette domain-containing protein [Clostridiales bacterium]|jgi:ABC-type bacteriocin/lantibiotic exporter with double-glycine peptidase domain|nr:ATP-binding cassette domain-containing protein [Clostridiales bacterium]
MKMPVVVQTHPGENAIAVIATMLSYYGCIKTLSELRASNISSRGGSTPEQVKDMAARYGLDTEIIRADASRITEVELPAVIHWKKRYYCIVKKIKRGVVYLADPAKGEYEMTLDGFLSKYSGEILIMRPGEGFVKGGKRQSLYDLIRYRMKGTWRSLLWLAALNMMAVGLNLLMVRATRLMLDTADPKNSNDDALARLLSSHYDVDIDVYSILVISMAVILVLATIVNILKTLLIFRTSYKVAASSGSGLFSRILAQPMQFFEQYRSGELIQRMEDNAKLDFSLVRTIVPRLLDFVMTFIYLMLMISYQWQVALACVSVEVVYLVVSLRLKGIISMQARANAVSTGNMNTSLLNGLDTIETIKAGGAERMFFSDWNSTQMEFDESRISGNNITAITGVLDSMHSLLSQAVLLFVGAYFMIQGNFTFGLMAALQSLLGNFRSAFSNCINMINNLQKTRTDIERIEDIRQRDIMPVRALADSDEPDKLPGTLDVSHVSYRYQEGEPLSIEDISFKAEPGDLIAVVGSSGCGKSTLLKCLLSLYTPESGEIRYGGLTRDEIPDVVFHSSITAVDQECVVFEDSIADNLTMWDPTIEEYEMILAARDAHIHSRIIREREGYYAHMLENGRNFSGGELQRMELARALSAEPNILLLDEFTSALDAITEAEVFKSIRDKGTTCVVVAHRLSTVASCDHILVMDKGRIVQRGTHEELMRSEGLYRQLLQVPEEA